MYVWTSYSTTVCIWCLDVFLFFPLFFFYSDLCIFLLVCFFFFKNFLRAVIELFCFLLLLFIRFFFFLLFVLLCCYCHNICTFLSHISRHLLTHSFIHSFVLDFGWCIWQNNNAAIHKCNMHYVCVCISSFVPPVLIKNKKRKKTKNIKQTEKI